MASTPGVTVRSVADTSNDRAPELRRDRKTARPRTIAPLGSELALEDQKAGERAVAAARLTAALVMLTVTAIHGPPLDWWPVRAVTILYSLHATGVAVANWRRPVAVVRRSAALHAVDIACFIAVTSLSGGATSPLFPFFAFVLASSSFHWGLRRTLVDGGILLVVTAAQSGVAAIGLTSWPFDLGVLVVSVALVGGLAWLFGAIAERERVLRAQVLALADLPNIVSRTARLAAALADALGRVMELFGARRALLVIEDSRSQALSLWSAEASRGNGVETTLTHLPREQAAAWLTTSLHADVSACELRRDPADGRSTRMSLSLDRHGRTIAAACEVPASILAVAPWRVLMMAPVRAPGFWNGQVYILDPTSPLAAELRLRFMRTLVGQLVPAFLNLDLLGRLRRRAETFERQRISRELHDGPLQSLAAIHMRLHVLRHEAEKVAPTLLPDLTAVGDLLHEEALELRELMERLRSARADAQSLRAALSGLVERFGRSRGIDARLDWAVWRLDLTPHQCGQVVRIVQEALVSARRHGGATRVTARVEADACAWGLIVEDNGAGLGLDGPVAGEQSGRLRNGVRVIRHRVAAMGGTLDVQSSSHGTRLEMTFAWPVDHRFDAGRAKQVIAED